MSEGGRRHSHGRSRRGGGAPSTRGAGSSSDRNNDSLHNLEMMQAGGAGDDDNASVGSIMSSATTKTSSSSRQQRTRGGPPDRTRSSGGASSRHRRTSNQSVDSQRSARSTGSSSAAAFKQRSASGSPNNSRRRVSVHHGSPQRSNSQRKMASSNSLAGLAGPPGPKARRASVAIQPHTASAFRKNASMGTLNLNDGSDSTNVDDSRNYDWQPHGSTTSSTGFSLVSSPHAKSRTRNIPPRVKSAGSSSQRRANAASMLHRQPSKDAPAKIQRPSKESSSDSTPSLSPNAITSFHANLMRPSQFSTHSTKVARQFLEETSQEPLVQTGGKPPRHTSSGGGGGTPPLEEEESFVHDLSVSESMATHPPQRHPHPAIGTAATSTTDLEWNPEAQRQQQEEWRNFQRRGAEAAAKSSKASRSFPERRDLREVDQTVNLMDASLGDYDNLMAPSTASNHNRRGTYYSHQTKKKDASVTSSSTSSGFFSQASSSLMEIFVDDRSADSSRLRRRRVRKQRRNNQYRENNVCQDLFCSRFTLVLLVAGLLGAFIAWQTGAFMGGEAPPSDGDDDDEFNVGDEPLDNFQALLIKEGISSKQDLNNVNTPQYLAWDWLTQHHMDDPTLLSVKVPESDEALQQVLLEAYALAVLYYGANGYLTYNTTELPYHKTVWRDNTNWMRPTPVCRWYGVECEGDNHVVHLNMTRNNLKGTLPSELKVLSDLRTLDFGRCGLTGTLPPDLFEHMGNLEYLYLHQNKITGTIPPTIGSMTNLRSLKLPKNELEGSLPSDINNMTSLQVLELQENRLTGTIPKVARLSNLQFLLLEDNVLKKRIPSEIFGFKKLMELRLGKNELTRSIPATIETMKALRIMALDNNLLKGTLPDKFEKLENMLEIHLQNNDIEGRIPVSFGALTNLEKLIIDTNKLTGTVPWKLSKLTELREFRLFHNDLSGKLPPGICKLKALEFIALDCKEVTNCNCCNECVV